MPFKPLQNKHVILGVTGGIAAYKSAMLTSQLVRAGATVDVILTEAAQRFITPLTFQALTHRRVYTDIFYLPPNESAPHVALASEADLLIIAPATANTIAKITNGLSDNLLIAIAIATDAPVLIAPAMETHMWQHPATQINITTSNKWGINVIGPATGRLASGVIGEGRMTEPDEIFDTACHILSKHGDMAGKRVLVTAGGTREDIDPVRYLTNHSTGRMGYAVAKAARNRGAYVTLISTAFCPTLAGVKLIPVTSAYEMNKEVLENLMHVDALIMAAAVADYRPEHVSSHKIKKEASLFMLALERTEDILQGIYNQRHVAKWPKCVVGFAAESEHLQENALAKIKKKGLDFIVANDITRHDSGFATDTNKVMIIGADGTIADLPTMTKTEVAHIIWDVVFAK